MTQDSSSPPAASTGATDGGRTVADHTPEARRLAARLSPEKFAAESRRFIGTRAYRVIQRMFAGLWNDGFIHAGNLAYMGMFAIFPFLILGAASLSLLGVTELSASSVTSMLDGLPPKARDAIIPVAESAIAARSGWLLWAGGLVGLWSTSSLVETIRDMLRRAYGTRPSLSFWRYRLLSFGVTLLAVLLLVASLIAQIAIGAATEVITAYFHQLEGVLSHLSLSRIVPAILFYCAVLLLFVTLTPAAYRTRRYPKWPGAALVTLWVVGVSIALPPLLRTVFSYDLTYGSLAGAMIALFFFWLVGLGMEAGVELNAALARTPEEEEAIA
jgi:membrane protein